MSYSYKAPTDFSSVSMSVISLKTFPLKLLITCFDFF